MKRALTVILLLLLSTNGAQAGELRKIELSDGSIITGEVISLANGVYTIRSGSLGTVTVNESRIRSIRSMDSSAPSSSAPSSQDVSALTRKMMADDKIMEMIRSLKDDPSFQKALEDPEIRNAISSGDTAALMANPKFLELMNNSTVQDIQRKMQN